MAKAATVYDRSFEALSLYSKVSSKQSSLRRSRRYGAVQSQQSSGELIPAISSNNRFYGAETADQVSTLSMGECFGIANVSGCGLHVEPHDAGHQATCSKTTSDPGQNNNQHDALDLTLCSLQSFQPGQVHVDASIVSDIKREQTLRRREQNKRSQQAYRERRVQYALDLESKVEEMDGFLKRLQLENHELLQRLCELRTKNISLRASNAESETSKEGTASGVRNQRLSGSDSETCIPIPQKELESLYEPYWAVCNLMSSYLPPRSELKDFTDVLAHLQAMVVRTMHKTSVDRHNG